jgi:hypothetical protein
VKTGTRARLQRIADPVCSFVVGSIWGHSPEPGHRWLWFWFFGWLAALAIGIAVAWILFHLDHL